MFYLSKIYDFRSNKMDLSDVCKHLPAMIANHNSFDRIYVRALLEYISSTTISN